MFALICGVLKIRQYSRTHVRCSLLGCRRANHLEIGHIYLIGAIYLIIIVLVADSCNHEIIIDIAQLDVPVILFSNYLIVR